MADIHIMQGKQKFRGNGLAEASAYGDASGQRPIEFLARTGKLGRSARKAIRAQTARGLAVTYKRGDEVIKEYADGRKEVLETLEPTSFKVPANVQIIGK